MIVLAHPLLEPGGLPVPPLTVAVAAVGAVAGSALLVRPAARTREGLSEGDIADPLSPGQRVWRVIGLAVLVLAAVAGLAGRQDQLSNIAPALIVGAGWPLLVLGSALFGDLWRWIDPHDTLARVGDRLTGPPAPAPTRPAAVWFAVPSALALTWYLSVYRGALDPAPVGWALTVYAVAMLSGALYLGRRAWLGRADVFRLFFSWCGLLRGGRLLSWTPPPGAAAVLGVLAGGLLFGALRISQLWLRLTFPPPGPLAEIAGFIGCALLGALLLVRLEHTAARRGAPGTAFAAAVPVVAGITVAFGLRSDRLLTSVQLVPQQLADPLGQANNDPTVYVNLLTQTERVAIQVGVLVVAGIVGAVIARRRVGEAGAIPAVTGVAVLVAAGVLAVSAV